MFVEHMKERERRKRAEEKTARKRKLQDFRELLERSSGIKVRSRCHHHAVNYETATHLESIPGAYAYAMFKFCHAQTELPCNVLSSGCPGGSRTVRFV